MARAKPAPFPGPLPPLPTIPPEERTPLVNVLLALLEHYRASDEQQRAVNAELEQRVHALEAEVRRLKNLPARPTIKPSVLDQDRDDDAPRLSVDPGRNSTEGLTWQHSFPCRLVLYKGKPKGRVHLNKFGGRSKTTTSMKQAKAHSEPWLLATSLPCTRTLAKEVVRLYRLRMQIEEAFRDLKSTRFGLGLELHLTYQVQRLQILLLIAALALLVAWVLGEAVELCYRRRDSVADRPV